MWSTFTQWMLYILLSVCVTSWLWTYTRILSLFRCKKQIPPIKNKLLLYSATKLADLIRKRKVTCQQVVQAYIDRVQMVNPILNCVVQERFAQAIQEAKDVDQSLAKEYKSDEELKSKTPLLGIPITIKESIGVQGMSNNAGRVVPKERFAIRDATAVTALKAAGAIPILVSNTPQFCQCWETFNTVTGTTNNPYDTRRTPGGSSGGEGAIISSAGSVIGLGSDIGGSGRIPAMFCGIFGHKPSSGYISNDNHMPYSEDPMWMSIFAYSPMCRYAEDLPLLYSSCIQDKEKLLDLKLNEPVDFKSIKFYHTDTDGSVITDKVDRDIKLAIKSAVTHFKTKYGSYTKKLQIEELKHSAQLSLTLMIRMKETQHAYQKSEDDVTKWRCIPWELLKWLFGCSNHLFYALLYGALKKSMDRLPKRTVQDLEMTKECLVDKLTNLLGKDGVLIYPVFPSHANYHGQIYYKLNNTGYMAIFNLIDFPATSCPMGLNKSGLPIGIQIIAARGQDRLTLAVAKEIEAAFGGWTPPAEIDLMEIKS
uniref:Amidase domain-containing protein n=1 Tax=Clastoptera arizonana TaxID=38151 RepID=A0A1B6CLB9_9HEMI